ncbi:MAG: hypothetical protein H0T83_09170 [Chthoniobacterales bacterium]|nr:hypothetical protein [Chthoniobacterales bacterium]
MNASLKGKLVAGFILASLAGGVTGSFLTFHQGRHWHSDFGHRSPAMADRMRERIMSQLDLTPEQLGRIEPILNRAGKELQQIRSETGDKVRAVLDETNQAVRPLLTDAQRARFETIEKKSRSKRGPRNPGRRHPPRDAVPDETSPPN